MDHAEVEHSRTNALFGTLVEARHDFVEQSVTLGLRQVVVASVFQVVEGLLGVGERCQRMAAVCQLD